MKYLFETYTNDADRLRGETRDFIEKAMQVIAEFQALGIERLTLRQLHYQFVSRNWMPNTTRDYKRLGAAIKKGRRSGLIPWNVIVDNTRSLQNARPWWYSAHGFMDGMQPAFRLDPWLDQHRLVEVWSEKDAILSVLSPICEEYRVPFYAQRGNNSDSAHEAAVRERFGDQGNAIWRQPLVLHIGDHDPNGVDMTRDNQSRFDMFMKPWMEDASDPTQQVEVRRIALNFPQIEQYGLPPGQEVSVKPSNPRAASYVRQYGPHSWEVDALPPDVLATILREAIRDVINWERWEDSMAHEAEERAKLQAAVATLEDDDDEEDD